MKVLWRHQLDCVAYKCRFHRMVEVKKRFLAFTGAPGEGGPDGNIPMPGMGGGKPYGGFYAGKGSRKYFCWDSTFLS